MFCYRCGAENPEGANFCTRCGTRLAVAAAPAEGTASLATESSTGMSANVAGLLCYLATWITGIIFVVLEKKSTFVKFHAWQSIMTFGALDVLLLILLPLTFIGLPYISVGPLYIGMSLRPLVIIVAIARFVLWIILMVQAGSGKRWKVPGAGSWAEKQANK